MSYIVYAHDSLVYNLLVLRI